MSDVNRREFVATALGVLGAACAGCLCETAGAAPAPASQSTGPVDVGTVADYPKDGTVNDKFAASNRIIVIRHDGKIYAVNNTCTHRQKPVKVVKDEMYCPSHGSKFSLEGTPTKGPAKSSLLRYAIAVNDKGKLIVDKSKQFEEKNWEKEGSFVKI